MLFLATSAMDNSKLWLQSIRSLLSFLHDPSLLRDFAPRHGVSRFAGSFSTAFITISLRVV